MIPALLLFAMVLRTVIELHLLQWLPVLMLANIFLLSLVEEALFRGVIQQSLSVIYLPSCAIYYRYFIC